MKIWLYDHREEHLRRFSRNLGTADKFSVTALGEISIKKTDYLYSLHLQLTKKEMETLRQRLNDIHDKTGRVKKPLAVMQAEEVLEGHGRRRGV